MEKNNVTAAIITLSDKGYLGQREDISGRVIDDILKSSDITVKHRLLLPDEKDMLIDSLTKLSDEVNLIVTTGGTGFSKRDITPEATLAVIERECGGITQAMLFNSLQYTKRAMLSRAVCGIRGDCIILNLPGSPKAVKECLEYVLDSLLHGIEILLGGGECGNA